MQLGLGVGIARNQSRGFTPSLLFFGGEKGVWYDPSDFSTLFQDAAGTTPVTAAGQPVGKILDKSGNGAHATQSTSTSRPILGLEGGRYYLTFDGVDDWLSTAAIDFTGTDKMTAVAGVRKLSDAAAGMVAELSATISSNNGSWYLSGPDNSAQTNFGFKSKGTVTSPLGTVTIAAGNNSVVAVRASIAGDSLTGKLNGGAAASFAGDQGTGGYGNYPLYIGRRGGTTVPFNGRLYGLIVRGAQSSDAQISASETYLNSKTGAY